MSSFTLGANYTFFSHSQRGAIVGTGSADTLAASTAPLNARVTPNIQLQVTPFTGGPTGTKGSPFSIPAPIQLYGPGDISGFDTRHVIRTEPLNLTANFEPTYYPAIEFDDPCIPWLFTPATPTSSSHPYISPSGGVAPCNDMRLRPWIVLIVLAEGEYTPGIDPLHPSITVASASSLPDLGDSWAWSHVQVVGDMSGDTLDDIFQNEPWRVRSRILCLRNLEPQTRYTAFLVPAFDAGCQAALGNASNPPATTVAAAWSSGASNITLPYFYSFQFTTSETGDFLTLVRQLQARTLSGADSRPMATDLPDDYWGTPPATTASPDLALGGALTTPDSSQSPINMLGQINPAFTSEVAKLISSQYPPSSDPTQPDPMIVPPLYGQWQAGQSQVASGAGWLNEVNLDPRWRVAAGLGAAVVTKDRDNLVAAAWDQIGPVQQANQLLRQAQMARGALGQSFARIYQSRSPAALLALTSLLHRRLLVQTSLLATGSASTISSQLPTSYMPPALVTTQARRLFRARGPIASRTSMPRFRNSPRDVASGSAQPIRVSVSTMIQSIAANGAPFTAFAIQAPTLVNRPTFSPLMLSPFWQTLTGALAPSTTIPAAVLFRIPSRPAGWAPQDPLEPIMAAPVIDSPMSVPLAALDERYFLPGVESIPPETIGALKANRPFIEAYMVGLNFEMGHQLLWHRYPTDQRGTYFRQFWPSQGYVPPGQTTPASPDQTYDILPINQWDPSSELGTNCDPQSIVPVDNLVLLIRSELLHRYPNTTITMQRAAFQTISPGFQGIFDFMQKIYPAILGDLVDAMVTDSGSDPRKALIMFIVSSPYQLAQKAQKASLNVAAFLNWILNGSPIGATAHVPAANGKRLTPLFRGSLSPDITYLGFDITADSARGSKTDPGWFFVFQNHPSEPRFGLDELPADSPLLVPGGFATIAAGLAAASTTAATPSVITTPARTIIGAGPAGSAGRVRTVTLDLAGAPGAPPCPWGQSAAAMAQVLFEQPDRVFFHAESLLLPDTHSISLASPTNLTGAAA
jgi:hypothetical protein